MTHTILIAEDDPVQRKMLSILLTKKLGYKIVTAENGQQAVKCIQSSNIDDISAVLLDLSMPEMDGFETLSILQKYRPDLPVLILTANDDTATAAQAIKEGASDFIVKPADPLQLDGALKNAIRLSTLSREMARLKHRRDGTLQFRDLIGYDAGLAIEVDYARKMTASDVPVLLTGETSTGKELLARAIHGESRRSGAPFIAIHCGAIPEPSIECVLFGQEKTANTTTRITGKFREAERGTLFLDDIHALPSDAQAKLLHALQQFEVKPVGAEKPVKVNVRVVSATDHNLKDMVKEGKFREDLYFRLNVLTIAIPPLRERKQDILLLAEYFLQRFSSLDGLPLKSLTPDAQAYLTDYAWPGNMRELEGLLHRALVLGEDETIDRSLLTRIHEVEYAVLPDAQAPHITLKKTNGLPKTIYEIEAEAMQKTLEYYQNNITRAAEALGMAKSTFYRKMKHFG